MIRHILRLMWHRKRHNVLIGLEIFISYLVLLGVMVIGVSYATFYRYPLGYDIDRVWRVGIRSDFRNDRDEDKAAGRQAVQQVLLALRDLPEVESVAGAFTAPYENASWGSGISVRGRKFDYGVNEVTDQYRDVIDLKLVAGRWFSREDDGVSWDPVIINLRAGPRHVRQREPGWSGVPQGSRAGRQGHVARRSRARGARNACRRHHRRLPAARRAVAAGALHVPSHAAGRSRRRAPRASCS